MTGASYVGGLVGQNENTIDRSIATANVAGTVWSVGGLVGFNISLIRDSYASGAVQGARSPNAIFYVGGLVGNNTGRVINSRADGDVSVPDGQGDSIGGLVGYGNHGSVTGSVATGAVTGTAASEFMVGRNQGSISGSAATGAVSGGLNVCGLVGLVASTGSVTESWASGDVSAIPLAGSSETGSLVGGLVGWNDGTVGASFATGNVTGAGSAGGLIGRNLGAVLATYATGNVTDSGSVPCTPPTRCPETDGGLIGFASRRSLVGPSDVQASYSTGRVSGSSTDILGGLAGTAQREDAPFESNSAVFMNSYWDTNLRDVALVDALATALATRGLA